VKAKVDKPEDSAVVDLMAALKKSLQGSGPERNRAERYTAARATRKKPSTRGRKAAA